ncbi:MAG: RNA polymerase sporulation sigma factor SigK [Clostridia bacterium]|nr:RNA polymerase sporulation sigma factor SigK [Clostridia bacterium]
MFDFIFSFLKDVLFYAGYVGNKNAFPEPLTSEEENLYISKLKDGDAAARAALIEHNLRLVAHIAKKYASVRRDMDDLISIGTVGLIKAVSTFKPDKGSTLATYAVRCIENEILMSLRAEKKQMGEISINDTIGSDKEGNKLVLSDVLGSDADDTHNAAELSIATLRLKEIMNTALSERERVVITLRFGLKDGCAMPQREVAAILGISRSYVSRIEKKAIKKLNEAFFE